MAASNEWTEWHLTNKGWVRGTEKDDFSRTDRETPLDSVLTVRWSEHLGSVHGTMKRWHEELWRSADTKLIDQLLKKYGDAPSQL